MKAIVRVCAILAISAPMFASSAQQAGIMTASKAFRPTYDASREITLTGNVRSISSRSKTPSGAHLLITTSQGLVDAHLGTFALQGSQPVSLHPGEQVRVVGVMTRAEGSPMLLVRTIQSSGKTFVIRNEHGALLFPRPAARGQVRFKTVIRGGAQQ